MVSLGPRYRPSSWSLATSTLILVYLLILSEPLYAADNYAIFHLTQSLMR